MTIIRKTYNYTPPPVWSTEQGPITGSGGGSTDRYGWSVAVAVDTMVVGCPRDDTSTTDAGGVYVYERSAGVWTFKQRLAGSDIASSDFYGISVAISDDEETIIVGSYGWEGGSSAIGTAYAYARNVSGTWADAVSEQFLSDSSCAAAAYSGCSVGISGDTAIVGAYNDTIGAVSDGSVSIWLRTTGTWALQQRITGVSSAQDRFGFSVDVDGDTAIIGAPRVDAKGGAVVYTRSGTTWTLEQTLVEVAGSSAGECARVDGNTAFISNSGLNTSAGGGYIWTRSGGTWTRGDELSPSGALTNEKYGGGGTVSSPYADSCDLRSGVVVVTTYTSNQLVANGGGVYVFHEDGGKWTENTDLGLVLSGLATGARIASAAVSPDGETIIVGCSYYSEGGADGEAYACVLS